VFNRQHCIGHCLDSLLEQDYPNLELVIVDDGSSDQTLEIIKRYQSSNQRLPISLVAHKTNLGVCASRNSGIKASHGNAILFTDSDCVAAPNWASEMVSHLFSENHIAIGGLVEEPQPRNLYEEEFWGESGVGVIPVLKRNLVGCNMAFRKEAFEQISFDENFRYSADDDDVERRLRNQGHKIGFAPLARVTHDHPLDRVSYFRMPINRAKGSAYFALKHRIVCRDIFLMQCAIVSTPLVFFQNLAAIPLLLIGAQVLLLLGNNYVLKRHSLQRALKVLPLSIVFNLVKAIAFSWHFLKAIAGPRTASPDPQAS
jgi:glycosyltransferase involved in cell wall biosynthesis